MQYVLSWLVIVTSTQSWVINAITRLVAQIGYLPEYVHSMIALHLTSVDTDVQQVISKPNHTHSLTCPSHHTHTHPLTDLPLPSQRCSELIELTQSLPLMQEVLPLDSACEDLEVTITSQLNTYCI